MSRTVLVTGSSSGIGRSTALLLASSGWRVYAGVRKASDGTALAAEATGELLPLELDVTRAQSVTAAVERLVAGSGGRLDGLVNNAGIYFGGPLELMQPEEIENTFAVNVTGLLQLTRACLPLLRAARGRIINVSSISGLVALPGVSVYAGSKHAVEAITDSLRVELAPFGVEVIAVEPGGVLTPLWNKSAARDQDLRRDRGAASVRELYGPLVKLLEKVSARPRGVSPDAVAAVIARALVAARPKNRYLIGSDARSLALLGRLPESLRDRLVAARIWR